MGQQHRLPGETDRLVQVVSSSGKAGMKDAGSAELAKMAKKLGNDELTSLVAGATNKRDNLLVFIQQRLQQMMQVQQIEMREMRDRQDWWRLVGQGKPGFGLPDPTRWRKPAGLYKQAAEALCNGNMGRAADLLDKAVEAERLAFQSLPVQIERPSSLQQPSGTPEDCASITAGDACPVTTAPEVMQAADRILLNSTVMDPIPVPLHQRRHNWWETPLEEDPDKKKNKPAGAPSAEQATAAKATAEQATAEQATNKTAVRTKKSSVQPEEEPEQQHVVEEDQKKVRQERKKKT